MYLKVTDVQPKPDYILLLTYANGEKKQFDVKPYLDRGIFKALKDPNVFSTVRPCFDSVQWANKADIDPETLYEDSIKVN